MTDAEILEKLRAYFQTKVENLNADEMAEGPFEDGTEFGDAWEAAAKVIDRRGGLRIRFEFADDEPGQILAEVAAERARQDAKWGEQNHPDLMPGFEYDLVNYQAQAEKWKRTNDARVDHRNKLGFTSDCNSAWDGILLEEVYEALAEADPAKLRTELVQVAAVAANWIGAIDRRSALQDGTR